MRSSLSGSSVWLPILSRNSPAVFNPSILRHNGIWDAADEATLNKVHKILIFYYLAAIAVASSVADPLHFGVDPDLEPRIHASD